MSERAISWAQEQRCPTPTAKFLLMRLAAYADADGVAWAYVERLADEMQTTARTVQRAMRQLEAATCGLIKRTGKFHHRNVPFYRLDLTRPGSRTVTPASPLNGDTSVTVQNANGDTSVTPNGDTGVTLKQGNPTEGRTNVPPSEGVGAGEAASPDDGFEALWASAPDLAKKGVSSHRQGLAAWRSEVAAGSDPVAMAVGVRAYFADRTAWGASGRPKAFHSVLAQGSWEGFVANGVRGAAFNAMPLAIWPGPDRVREAFAAELGNAWVGVWLDPSGWSDSGNGRILARTGVAADRIAADGRRVLADLQISVGKA